MNSKKQIILASASSRRKKILAEMGLEFTVQASDADEAIDNTLAPERIVQELALRKAASVAARVSDINTLIIGADTIVVLLEAAGHKIIGKPGSIEDAEAILKELSGTTHYVYTGLAVINKETAQRITGYEVSTVRMKELTDREVAAAAKKHLDKAGAYGIQEESDAFVELIKGPYDNVVGLPSVKLKEMLAGICG